MTDLPSTLQPMLLAMGGIGFGLVLLWRGMAGHGQAARIADTSRSRIASLAAGEVLVSGTVEAAEMTLVSPLRSEPCVWYRASIERSDGESERTVFEEERAIGFRIRDDSGSIRVFPRGARVDAPTTYDERTGLMGDEPPGLRIRDGGAYATPVTELDRDAAIAQLLTVRPTRSTDDAIDGLGGGAGGLGTAAAMFGFGASGSLLGGGSSSGRKRYREASIGIGDTITVVGTALPFGHLPDPGGADVLDGGLDPGALQDEETAASIAEAREAGILVSPEEAWGNAAIPGFGIGRPVSAPELDPAAIAPALATPDEVARIERTWDLAPDVLVLAVDHGSPLLIATGAPQAAQARQEGRFLVGLLGAILAIASAVALAALASGALA